MQNLLGVLEEFCHSSGLVVNVEKTKMMVVQTSNLIITLCSHIEVNIYNLFEALSILVLMLPATNKWSACFDSRLQASWKLTTTLPQP